VKDGNACHAAAGNSHLSSLEILIKYNVNRFQKNDNDERPESVVGKYRRNEKDAKIVRAFFADMRSSNK
jgi:hypothetical protein